jgi:hypothetical protein
MYIIVLLVVCKMAGTSSVTRTQDHVESPRKRVSRKVVSYKIKKLKWESERMKKAKKVLDKCYLKTLTQRAQDRILPRVVSHELSSRQSP